MPCPPPVHGSSIMSDLIRKSVIINNKFSCFYVNISTSRTSHEVYNFSILLLTKKILRLIFSLFRTFFYLVFFRVDLCYLSITCHGVGFLKDMPFVLLCKIFNKKIIIHQHNKGMSKYSNKILYRQLLKLVYSKTKVILLSWLLYKDVSEIVDKQQIRIVPNGLPLYRGNNNILIKNNKIKQLLYLGNLIPEKGIYILLETCKNLKNLGILYHCHIVGEETIWCSKYDLENTISKYDLCKFVTYHGALYDDHKEKIWDIADIFIFPSYYHNECFPLVLIEAMMHHVPCITSSEGAIADIVKSGLTGEICDKLKPDIIASKIIKLINNDTCMEKMKINSYQRYQNYFTDKCFEDKIYNILCENE